ncbi:MAG: type II secretion system protein [Candidatus Pacebacteria bacterium]|nr:type II secretion system protein [Candidatus Paceibacterota bacterium]
MLQHQIKFLKGFTLLELLIVIAIIGILSAVILTRYPIAFNQGKDARIMSDLSQFRVQAGIVYQGDRNFNNVNCTIAGNICTCSSSILNTLCNNAQKYSDQTLIFLRNTDRQGFCMVAHLPGDRDYFCIDGKLYAKRYPVAPPTCAATCVSTNNCRCE